MKTLYISCLNTSEEKFDGERIKCTLIHDSLKKFLDLSVINLSKHKLINSLSIFLKSLFGKKKYDYIIISKDAHGANIIQKLLRLSRFPSNRIVYFEIGPFLYDRILDGSIKKDTFIDDRLIVVETESMKNELESIGFKRISVFPNFKQFCPIDFYPQKYPKDILKLVYLSRIEEQKGIYDLIKTLIEINKDKIRFELDIFGRPQSDKDEYKIKNISKLNSFIHYLGMIEVNSKESYVKLSNYDLHIFPTKYREGFPGSIIDFFIAGVPTLSSSFARSKEILSEKDSLIFEQGNNESLKDRLLYIFNNQEELSELRKNSFVRRKQYSVESFEEYLKTLIENDFN